MSKMQLNCDLGESFGAWTMGLDAEVMPHIDQANVATGFHAGDPLVIQHTLRLAKEHGVCVGAHPAYPDLVGFGRRSMNCTHEEIIAMIHYQVAALDGMASCADMELRYVKPHGALYNDMMAKDDVRLATLEALAEYYRPLALMMQATPEADAHRKEAEIAGVEVWFEFMAPRLILALLVPYGMISSGLRPKSAATSVMGRSVASCAMAISDGTLLVMITVWFVCGFRNTQ